MIQVDVGVALLANRDGKYLCPWNRKWGAFSLPMSRLRSGTVERDTPQAAALRAAAEAAGVPVRLLLGGSTFQVSADGLSRRQMGRKQYCYAVYPVEPHPDFAAGWKPVGPHLWLSLADARDAGYEPLSWTVATVLGRAGAGGPAVVRHVRAALALISQPSSQGPLWLANWNASWQGYHFVGGRLRPGETAEHCLARKFAQELDLSPREFQLGERVCDPLVYTGMSRRTRVPTEYHMDLRRVTFTAGTAEGVVLGNPANRWLSAEEIRAGRAGDNRRVSDTMHRLLDQAGWPA